MPYKTKRIWIPGYYKLIDRKRLYVKGHYKDVRIWVPSRKTARRKTFWDEITRW